MSRDITRNTSGFSGLSVGHPLADLDIGNRFKWSEYFQDFTGYGLAQTTGDDHLLTQTNCTETIVGNTGDYTMTLGGADNDLGQWKGTSTPFQMTSTKRLFFQARFKLTLDSGGTVAANELFVGLASADTGTSFFAADGLSLTMDDALGFYKLDAVADMAVTMRENDSGSVVESALTPTDGGSFTVAIFWDGAKATFYASPAGGNANGDDMTEVASLTSVDVTSVVKPQLYIKAGEAKANVLSCDYIGVWLER